MPTGIDLRQDGIPSANDLMRHSAVERIIRALAAPRILTLSEDEQEPFFGLIDTEVQTPQHADSLAR